MPSSGQMMPVASMWGKQAPMESFIASMLVSHTVDKKKPKLIPAKPATKMCGVIWLFCGPFMVIRIIYQKTKICQFLDTYNLNSN